MSWSVSLMGGLHSSNVILESMLLLGVGAAV